MNSRNLSRWLALHRWTSLIVTLNLTVFAITGLYLIFHHEIDEAIGAVPEVEGVGQARLPLGEVVEAALRANPGWRPMSYAEDADHPGLVYVEMSPPGVNDFAKAEPLLFNAHTGQQVMNLDETLSSWVLKLHVNLFLGVPGQLFLALVGLCLLVSIISGVVLYAPFVRGLLFGQLRREKSKRVFRLDLHNLVGICTLGWLLMVTGTGVILSLSQPLLAIYQARDLAAMTADYKDLPPPEEVVPLERAASAARSAWPDHEVQFAIFPGTPYSGEHHYTFFMGAGEGLDSHVLKLALINASDASITVAREAPFYIKAFFISGPLHFGDYAGLPLRIIWALFTILTLVLCVTGIYLTIARLRGRSGNNHQPKLA